MPPVIPSVAGQRLDDLHRRRRHDVRRPTGVAMEVEQPAGLGADLVEQARQHLGVEGDEVVLAHSGDGPEDAVTDAPPTCRRWRRAA